MLAVALLLLGVGCAISYRMNVSVLLKNILVAVWLGWGLSELRRFRRGFGRVRRIGIDAAGRAYVLGRAGERRSVRLLEGSALWQKVGWLRVRFDDGLVYAELLWFGQVKPELWRRLQVIWRWGQ